MSEAMKFNQYILEYIGDQEPSEIREIGEHDIPVLGESIQVFVLPTGYNKNDEETHALLEDIGLHFRDDNWLLIYSEGDRDKVCNSLREVYKAQKWDFNLSNFPKQEHQDELEEFLLDRLEIEPKFPLQRVNSQPHPQTPLQSNEKPSQNWAKILVICLIIVALGFLIYPYITGPTEAVTVVSYDPSCPSSKAEKITNEGKSCLLRDEVIQIGGTLSLSGKHEQIGKDYRQGFNLCADHINAEGGLLGQPVVFVIEDDQSEGDVSKGLYEKLITEEQVDLIMGPYSSSITLPASEVAAEHGYPMIAPGASSPTIWEQSNQYVFGFHAIGGANYLKGAVDIARQKELTKVAILAQSGEGFTAAVLRGTRDLLLDYDDMKIVYQGVYEYEEDQNGDPSEKTRQEIASAVQMAQNEGAEVLLGVSFSKDARLIVENAKKIDFQPRMFAFTIAPALPEFAEKLGNNAELIFGTSEWDASLNTLGADEFVKAYQKRFHKEPSYQATSAYGACQLLQRVVENVGELDKELIRDELQKIEIETVFGPYKVDDTGKQIDKQVSLIQVQEGKPVRVWPFDSPAVKPYELPKVDSELKILQWEHPISSYNQWFEKFAQEWGGENEVNVTVEFMSSFAFESRFNSDNPDWQGYDLIEFPFVPAQFEPHVLDLSDLNQKAQAKFGEQVELCYNSSYNPSTNKFYGLCHGWVPTLGHYNQSMWEQVRFPNGPSIYHELLVGGTQIREKLGKQVGIALAPELDSNIAVAAILSSFGASVQDENENVVINSNETRAAVKYMVQLYEQAMSERVLAWEDSASNDQCLIEQKCSYIFDSITAYYTALEQNPEVANDTFFVKPPKRPNGEALAVPYATQVYVIPDSPEKNRETSEAFLLHLASNSHQVTSNSQLVTLPAWSTNVPELSRWLEEGQFTPDSSNKLAVLKDAEQWTTNIGHPGPANAAVMEVFSRNILPNMVARVVRDGLSAEDAVAEAEVEIEKIFEKWRETGLVGGDE